MDLIYFSGMNCRIAAIINIVRLFGLDFTCAFADLWAEYEFKDDSEYGIFTSMRIYRNLRKMGILFDAEADILQIPDGTFLLIGMDIFDIPWHNLYRHFHDRHFFFACKESSDSFVCFDPVYGKSDMKISPGELQNAFELSRVYKVNVKPHEKDLRPAAEEIIALNPLICNRLVSEIRSCENAGRYATATVIKQITEMINNRRLFALYAKDNTFNDLYFQRWEAVKNGLYKASILNGNADIIKEVCALLSELLCEEISISAKYLI